MKKHEVKVSTKARRKGAFELRPRVLFVDEKGRGDFLVTGDRDLRAMRRVGQARIFRTMELVKMIKPGC